MTAATSSLAARLGRKRVYLLSIAGFTAASFFCATSASLESEVIFRTLQGLSTGAGIVVSRAIVRDLYPLVENPRWFR